MLTNFYAECWHYASPQKFSHHLHSRLHRERESGKNLGEVSHPKIAQNAGFLCIKMIHFRKIAWENTWQKTKNAGSIGKMRSIRQSVITCWVLTLGRISVACRCSLDGMSVRSWWHVDAVLVQSRCHVDAVSVRSHPHLSRRGGTFGGGGI